MKHFSAATEWNRRPIRQETTMNARSDERERATLNKILYVNRRDGSSNETRRSHAILIGGRIVYFAGSFFVNGTDPD